MLDLRFLYLLFCVRFDQVGFRDGADGRRAGAVQGITNVVFCPMGRVCWSVGAVAGFVGAVVVSQAR